MSTKSPKGPTNQVSRGSTKTRSASGPGKSRVKDPIRKGTAKPTLRLWKMGKLSSIELAKAIHDGLPAAEVTALKEALSVSSEQLAPMLGTSTATLNRRRREGRLTPVEGDRLIRYARLYTLALEVMGTPEFARQWLATPQRALGGATPLDHALTELGAREVENLLGRIEHGVYT